MDYPLLSSSLNDLVRDTPPYYLGANLFFNVLLSTGCRPIEAIQLERWSNGAGADINLQCAKGQGVRVLDSSKLPYGLLDAIASGVSPYPTSSFYRYSYVFNLLYAYPQLSLGGKEVCLYAFRYHYFRMLYEDGYTSEEIQDHMQESSLRITEGYIFQDIEF